MPRAPESSAADAPARAALRAPDPHSAWEDEPWLDPGEDEGVLDGPTMEPGSEAGHATWDLSEYEGDEPWLIPGVPVPVWSDGTPAEALDDLEDLPADALAVVH